MRKGINPLKKFLIVNVIVVLLIIVLTLSLPFFHVPVSITLLPPSPSGVAELDKPSIFNYTKNMKRKTFLIYLTFLFITCTSVMSGHAQGSQSYKIGDKGPAGGIVFYDKGDNSDGWQYLEAAPPEFEFEANWNSAKDMCKLLNINGITGWRLPNRDELSFMYLNLKQKGLGGFSNVPYWSSTEEHNILTFTMYHHFGNGLVLGADRLGRGIVSYKFRAIREF